MWVHPVSSPATAAAQCGAFGQEDVLATFASQALAIGDNLLKLQWYFWHYLGLLVSLPGEIDT
jgi:hypothetical protein